MFIISSIKIKNNIYIFEDYIYACFNKVHFKNIISAQYFELQIKIILLFVTLPLFLKVQFYKLSINNESGIIFQRKTQYSEFTKVWHVFSSYINIELLWYLLNEATTNIVLPSQKIYQKLCHFIHAIFKVILISY